MKIPSAEKSTAAALREDAERYRFLADAVPLIIWTARPDGGLDYYNKTWFDYTGLTLAQTVDWGWGAVLHPEDLQPCIDRWTRSISTGESYEIQYRFKRAADGAYRWFLGRASARRNEAGQIVQWVGTCTDIDDQKRARSELESEIAERTAELAETNAALRLENTARERAAAALRESERFLRSTLDALSSHIAILDEHGTIIEVNRAWKRFAGENDASGDRQGVGENYLAVCDAAAGGSSAEATLVALGIRAVMAGQSDKFHFEYPRHSPREQRWFVVRATRFRGDGPVRVVVAHEDITERKQAEKSLRDSNEKFHQLADNITDVFWIRSPDLREVQYISPAFERIWGRSVESLRADPQQWVDFILPADRERVVGAFAALTADASGLDIEYRIVRPDGELRWVHVRGYQIRDAAGKLVRHTGIVSDITERHRAQEALRASEERMRLQTAALESAANGVAITDRKGAIQWVNAAYTQLTGYSAEESVGHTPRLLKSGQHPKSFYDAMWKTISRGQVWNGEVVNRHKGGELYHEEMTITPVRDASGAITHFVAIQQDIGERKRAEAAIQDLHHQLVEASREAGKAEVAVNVLHNVGNVLNSVNVSATLVMDRIRESKIANLSKIGAMLQERAGDLAEFLTTDEKGRQIPAYLVALATQLGAEREIAIEELDHLRKNIEHIKGIVAMQQGHAKNSGFAEAVRLVDVVEDALRMNARSLGRYDVGLVRDFQIQPTISTDQHKIVQILVNLMRNAEFACNETGRTDKEITVQIAGDAQRVKISVSDNGVGIPAENLTRIFNHGFTTRKDGHGYGLHSGALAARELGGTLHVHSEGSGQGATFTLDLPCQPGPPIGPTS